MIFPKGNKWVLVKLKHFPAWHAHGGRTFAGPGGTMIVRAHSPRVILEFAFPSHLYALGAVGLALDTLAPVLRARSGVLPPVLPRWRSGSG